MQIRLTVLGPRGGHPARACDVLVTAPAGTALAAVAGSLAAAVAGPGADAGGPVVLYAGAERLDPQRAALGEPPLIDGAVLSLQSPGPDPAHGLPHGPARLRVVSGPDAGGVHLLHGGQIRVGRSADADVPLDDPDVSRMHCAVTVEPDGAVFVADLRSTNGTTVDGTEISGGPARLGPGALLRVGESALLLQPPAGAPDPALATTPDGEGQLRLRPGAPSGPAGSAPGEDGPVLPGGAPAPTVYGRGTGTPGHGAPGGQGAPGVFVPGSRRPEPVPPAAPVPPADADGAPAAYDYDAYGAHHPYGTAPGDGPERARQRRDTPLHGTRPDAFGPSDATSSGEGTHGGQLSLAPPDEAARRAGRRGGIGAWARRLAGGRPAVDGPEEPDAPEPLAGAEATAGPVPADPGAAERWPDAAAVLLTALGPGPRLWERDRNHPDALTVRLGTASRAGGRVAEPVAVELRRAGSLGLAGPRERLAGLARSVLAQLAALHAPGSLEIVLLSTDRTRAAEERVADWSWLGWLPHVRPAHGQDCRLLLAYDKEQAAARTAELVRRLDDGPLGPGWASAERAEIAAAAAQHQGAFTVVLVDGDLGSSALRETAARLAAGGPAAGIHLLCLAETPAASPAFPLAATYEAARVASPAFGECGAVAVLSGDVATALRVVQPGSGPNGTVATLDAVSGAWAERVARALAPLRETDAAGGGRAAPRVAAPLPDSSRLLDELGLARATPASLMARWAAALDGGASGAAAVLGAGPHGPLAADLAVDGSHLLLEGAPGTGKTELLRSLAASLAAADRPDLQSLVLVDGGGTERGEGLRLCTELPHVTTYLAASDPVRMREFAQALSSELKRRAEVLGGTPFAEWRAKHLPAPRIVAQRRTPEGAEPDPSPTGTLRLRSRGGEAAPDVAPMPRLFVLVDDFDALVAPALGSTGRPSAGSVVRALEAVARGGAELGVHLIAATGHPERTAETATSERAGLRAVLGEPDDPSEPVPPGRGVLHRTRDGASTPFQAGRVTGRIPRTATLRPTVVPLEWSRMGDPPTRRPVRELGNGPTDLALLASALQRAAQSSGAAAGPPLA
ncbi:FHA domain-containing protein [Streptomyces benahoarensis]|nr:FtsK/SpoIIIE domain-containing protein [Streptomyces benahoarensis]TSB22078.1 FHA domain-containing protein [Streptomyces benahoarensis]